MLDTTHHWIEYLDFETVANKKITKEESMTNTKILPWVFKNQMLEYCLAFAEGKTPSKEEVTELFNVFCQRVRSEIEEDAWIKAQQAFQSERWSTAKEIKEMTEIILFIQNSGRMYGQFFKMFCSNRIHEWMRENYPQLSENNNVSFFLEKSHAYRHQWISSKEFLRTALYLFKEEEDLWEAYEQSVHCAAEIYKCALEMEMENK